MLFFVILIVLASVILGGIILIQNPKGGGLAANVGAQPITPDRRTVVGLDPRVAQHLLRHRHARLQPRLPSLEETARSVHADEIALGGELSEKSGRHVRQSPFGHLNCLSAGMLRGLAREDEVN